MVDTKFIINHANGEELDVTIETHVNPISRPDYEIVLSVQAQDINNNVKRTKVSSESIDSHAFLTDANGLFNVERVFNYKEGYEINMNNKVTVQYNYYPVNSAISIEDLVKKNKRLVLMTDRSQGGTGRKPGQMELMIHRVATTDDGFGVEEPLTDIDPDTRRVREVDLTHHLILAEGTSSSDFSGLCSYDDLDERAQRKRQYKIDNPPVVYIGKSDGFNAFKSQESNK